MAESILSWNVTNWVTVLLMVGVGFGIIAFGVKLAKRGTAPAQAA